MKRNNLTTVNITQQCDKPVHYVCTTGFGCWVLLTILWQIKRVKHQQVNQSINSPTKMTYSLANNQLMLCSPQTIYRKGYSQRVKVGQEVISWLNNTFLYQYLTGNSLRVLIRVVEYDHRISVEICI